MEKIRKNLGIGLLPIAGLFLCNPNLSIVDILPDIIGYILICIALRPLGDLNYHINEALIYFKRMIYVSAGQLLAIFWVFGLATPAERPVAHLLFTFTVSLFEVLFLVKAFREMYEGFLYLGSRNDSVAVFAVSQKQSKTDDDKNVTTAMSRLTTIFVVVKAVMTTLPEFSSLSTGSMDETTAIRVEWYNFISAFRTLAIMIVLPLGIFFAIRLFMYIRLIQSDRPFMERLTEQYKQTVLPHTGLFVRRAFSFAFAVLCVGIALNADIYIDHNSILPDFLAPVFVAVFLFLVRKYVTSVTLPAVFCVTTSLSSLAVYILSSYFYSHYTLHSITFSAPAHDFYLILQIVSIVGGLSLVAMLYFIIPLLRQIVEKYTGFVPQNAENFHLDDKITYVHKTLNHRVTVLFIMFMVSAVASTAYPFVVPYLGFMGILDFVIDLVVFIYLLGTVRAINDEVENKYLLND